MSNDTCSITIERNLNATIETCFERIEITDPSGAKRIAGLAPLSLPSTFVYRNDCCVAS